MGQLVARRLLRADNGNQNSNYHQRRRRASNSTRRQTLWQILNFIRGTSGHNHFPGRSPSRTARRSNSDLDNFPDLHLLPPEIGIEVLKNLNATDLCLASCVWTDLANDEMLWEGLCKTSWGYCSAYREWKLAQKSFKRLYLLLDEGSLTFNCEPKWLVLMERATSFINRKLWVDEEDAVLKHIAIVCVGEGMKYLLDNNVLDNGAKEIALFIHRTNQLCWQKVRVYLKTRSDVLEELIMLQNYTNQFLPNALRKFFQAVDSPTSRGEYLNLLIDKFSLRFCNDNPHLTLTPEIVNILCYSLILLSVDLTSPHVKNKMSKREFIRNICSALGEQTRNGMEPVANGFDLRAQRLPPEEEARRRAIAMVDKDFAGHLYDNIYLVGHVAPQRWDEG